MLPVALLAISLQQNDLDSNLATPLVSESSLPAQSVLSTSAQPEFLLAQSITPADTNTVLFSTGNQIDITGGQVSGDGANLFHSFDQFGLSEQQTANFVANPQIQNVLGQVQGGDASYIDGILKVSNSDANLYLLNPAGILFGQNAQLDLNGSFTAATADRVGFDGGWLDIFEANDHAQLTGNPIRFSFGAVQPGSLVNLGNLAVDETQNLMLLGGNIINAGSVSAPEGRITLTATNGQKLVSLGSADNLLTMELAPLATDRELSVLSLPELLTGGNFLEGTELAINSDGTVSLAGAVLPAGLGTAAISGTIDVGGNVGGNINLLGQRVALLNTTLDTTGTTDGGNIRIGGGYQGQAALPNAEQIYISADSLLRADALESGNAGQVVLWADDSTQFLGEITARGGTSFGNGGFVEVSGKENLAFVGTVDVSASTGSNGSLLLDPQRVVIGVNGADNAQLDTGQIFASDPGGTFNISSARVVELLNNGDVTIAADENITVETDIDASGSTGNNGLTLTSDLIALNASIYTNNGDLTFAGPVFVGNNLTLNTGTVGGDITFQETLNGVNNSYDLTLFAGTGDIRFQDTVGVFRNIPGSSALTFQIADINPDGSSFAGPFTTIGSLVYFAANDGIVGRELWRSDGTEAGTQLVRDIYPGINRNFGTPNSSSPTSLTNVNGTLFFTANDGVVGTELWRSDGTEGGTQLVRDIYAGINEFDTPNSSSPSELINVNGTLFFTAKDDDVGRELWRSNGTEAGTQLVRDIYAGVDGTGNPNNSSPSELTRVNNTLFFEANDGVTGTELWRSDGTEIGTFLVRDIYPGITGTGNPNSSLPSNLTDVNGTLFFTANDGANGHELWRSNGTNIGTQLVANINPGNGSSSSNSLTNVNGTLFFTANDGTNGQELWRSDGTNVGTQLVANINPGNGSSSPDSLTNVNGTLFFTASDGTNGQELWRSDGTGLGTQLVANINPGNGSSSPDSLTNVNGTLFFTASDGTNGQELWRSDGTGLGTQLVANINPETSSFIGPDALTDVNGTLFFTVDNGVNGTEIWQTNGVPAPFVLGQLGLQITDPVNTYAANNVIFQADVLTEGITASTLASINSSGAIASRDGEAVTLESLEDITTGSITSSPNAPITLNSAGNITTGSIRALGTSSVDGGAISVTAGGRIVARLVVDGQMIPANVTSPGQNINLTAGNNILVGAVDSNGFSTDSSVTLIANNGDIQVGYVDTGAGGINIEAAGSFRAVDAFVNNFSPGPVNYPPLVDFLVAQGHDREAVLAGDVFLANASLPVSLIARPDSSQIPEGDLNAPITIRYGDRMREIANIEYEIDGRASQILIQGDSKQPFVMGPVYAGPEFVPNNSSDSIDAFDPANPFEFTTGEGTPYIYPSEAFPTTASGLAAGIAVGEGTDSSLYGSLQSQLFEGIDDGGTDGGGTDGGGTDGGGTGGGGIGTGGGSTGEVTTITEVPQSVNQIENETSSNICDEIPENTVAVNDLLSIDGELLPDDRSVTASQLVSNCGVEVDDDPSIDN